MDIRTLVLYIFIIFYFYLGFATHWYEAPIIAYMILSSWIVCFLLDIACPELIPNSLRISHSILILIYFFTLNNGTLYSSLFKSLPMYLAIGLLIV